MADRTIMLRADIVGRLEALAKQKRCSVDNVLTDWLERITPPTSESDRMLEAMAADPDIQREIKQIQAEFDRTEAL